MEVTPSPPGNEIVCLKDQDWKMFGLKLNKCDLQNLKTWGNGSDKQLQVIIIS